MLKFGAVELFKDDSNTDQHLEGLDLDTVLKEAETRVQDEEAGAGHELLSQFKVSFNSCQFTDRLVERCKTEELNHLS